MMAQEELLSLKENGKKGDFLLPFVAVSTVMPDFYTTYPMHWHEEMEIVLVEDGEFDEFVDLQTYHVKKGDIIIINPCLIHSFRASDGIRTKFRSVIFNMSMLISNNTDACSIKYFTPFMEKMYFNPVVISPNAAHYEELYRTVHSMINMYDEQREFYEVRIKAELYNLFYLLFSYFFDPMDYDPGIKDTTTRNIKTILDYIGDNYTEPITIDELAEKVGLSKHYFMRFFKKYLGMTCIEYINDYRLNVAANLLLTTSCQITEVASRVGISNLSYFNRIFKKKFAMTPKEYRYNVDNRQ